MKRTEKKRLKKNQKCSQAFPKSLQIFLLLAKDQKMAARPLVVCGPSGVGKGTLLKRLFDDFPADFGFGVSRKFCGGFQQCFSFYLRVRSSLIFFFFFHLLLSPTFIFFFFFFIFHLSSFTLFFVLYSFFPTLFFIPFLFPFPFF